MADSAFGTVAAQTCYLYGFHPNTNSYASVAAANSGTPITVATAVGPAVPGYTHLNGSAQKIRALASAIRFSIPSLSITTIVGEFCVGVMSLDSFTALTTVDQAFNLSQGRGNITRDLHEVRWYPGSFDSKYSTYGNISTSDASDTNVLYFAVRGIPASTVIPVQTTSVVEWTAKPNSGLSVSGATSSGTDHQHTVNTLHSHTPGWHHTAKSTGERLLEDVIGHASKAVEKWAPKMIQGGLSAFGL